MSGSSIRQRETVILNLIYMSIPKNTPSGRIREALNPSRQQTGATKQTGSTLNGAQLSEKAGVAPRAKLPPESASSHGLSAVSCWCPWKSSPGICAIGSLELRSPGRSGRLANSERHRFAVWLYRARESKDRVRRRAAARCPQNSMLCPPWTTQGQTRKNCHHLLT